MFLKVMLLHLCDFIADDLVPIVLATQNTVGFREPEIDMSEVSSATRVMENEPSKVTRPKPFEAEDNGIFFQANWLCLGKLGVYGHLVTRICCAYPSLRDLRENPDTKVYGFSTSVLTRQVAIPG